MRPLLQFVGNERVVQHHRDEDRLGLGEKGQVGRPLVKIEKPHHIALRVHPVERSGDPIGNEMDAGLDRLDAIEIAESEPDAERLVRLQVWPYRARGWRPNGRYLLVAFIAGPRG